MRYSARASVAQHSARPVIISFTFQSQTNRSTPSPLTPPSHSGLCSAGHPRRRCAPASSPHTPRANSPRRQPTGCSKVGIGHQPAQRTIWARGTGRRAHEIGQTVTCPHCENQRKIGAYEPCSAKPRPARPNSALAHYWLGRFTRHAQRARHKHAGSTSKIFVRRFPRSHSFRSRTYCQHRGAVRVGSFTVLGGSGAWGCSAFLLSCSRYHSSGFASDEHCTTTA